MHNYSQTSTKKLLSICIIIHKHPLKTLINESTTGPCRVLMLTNLPSSSSYPTRFLPHQLPSYARSWQQTKGGDYVVKQQGCAIQLCMGDPYSSVWHTYTAIWVIHTATIRVPYMTVWECHTKLYGSPIQSYMAHTTFLYRSSILCYMCVPNTTVWVTHTVLYGTRIVAVWITHIAVWVCHTRLYGCVIQSYMGHPSHLVVYGIPIQPCMGHPYWDVCVCHTQLYE